MGGSILPVLMLAALLAQPAAATVLPGGGPAKSDCYVTLKTDGTSAATSTKKLECTEGDPSCDTDGCGNGKCTIGVQLCINQTGFTGCTPPSRLSSVTVKKNALTPPSALDSSACGAIVDEVLPLVVKKGKERPSRPLTFGVTAKAPKGTKPPADKDSYTIRCLPRTTACPTTTTAAPTTSTSTSSTSTTSTSVTSTTSTSTTETTTSTTVTTTTETTTTTVAGSTTTTVETTTTTIETTTTIAGTTSTTLEATTTTVEPTTTTVEPTTTTVESTTTTIETTTTTVETTTSTVESTTTTVETTTTTIETTTTTIP